MINNNTSTTDLPHHCDYEAGLEGQKIKFQKSRLSKIRQWASTLVLAFWFGESAHIFYFSIQTLLGRCLSVVYLLISMGSTWCLHQSKVGSQENLIYTMYLLEVKLVLFLAELQLDYFLVATVPNTIFQIYMKMWRVYQVITYIILFQNTLLTREILPTDRHKKQFGLLALLCGNFFSLFMSFRIQREQNLSFWFQVMGLFFCFTTSTLSFIFVVSVQSLHEEQSIQEAIVNERNKRILNALKDPIIIIKDGLLSFQNRTSHSLFPPALPDNLNASRFFIFKAAELQEAKRPDLEERSWGEGISVVDFLKMKSEFIQDQIFTTKEELAVCDSIDKLESLIGKFNEKREKNLQLFFQIKVVPIDQDGQEIMVEFSDISQRVLGQSLRLERQYMTLMNSTISHEMRNPLNSIQSQIHMIENLVSREDFPQALQLKKCLKITKSSCKMLKFNVEDILSLPQLKQGKFSKNPQLIDLATTVQEIAEIIDYQATERGLQVSTKFEGFPMVDGRADFTIQMDQQRFQQVLLNYLSNAAKFTPSGGRLVILVQLMDGGHPAFESDALLEDQMDQLYGESLLEAELPHPATLQDDFLMSPPTLKKTLSTQQFLRLSVLDTGVGIKPLDQQKLFKIFGCLAQTRKLNTAGIGLGLLISKMICHEFGGQVNVASKLGKGSIFQATFKTSHSSSYAQSMPMNSPKAEAEELECIMRKNQERQIESCKQNIELSFPLRIFNQKRILVVDDEPFNCTAIESMLRILNFENIKQRVDFCYSGQDALHLLDKNLITTSKLGTIRAHLGKSKGLFVDVDQPCEPSSVLEPSLDASRIERADTFAPWEEENEADVVLLDDDDPSFSARDSSICKYGLIITDLSMPGIDGFELAKKIRDSLEFYGIRRSDQPPIVAVTGHVEREYMLHSYQCGIDQVFAKPIDSVSFSLLLIEHGFNVDVSERVRQKLGVN